MKTFAGFAIAALISLQVASAPEIKQDYPPVALGTEARVSMSVIWKGEKKPENASASVFISKGPVRDVFTFCTVDQLRTLHKTIGQMLDAIDGK